MMSRIAVRGMVPLVALLAMLTPARAQSQEECTQRVLQAEAAGITYGQGIVAGVPTVMVDEATWRSIDFATKLGMVDTFNCAVAGPGQVLREINFVSNLTNKSVGRWTPGAGLAIP